MSSVRNGSTADGSCGQNCGHGIQDNGRRRDAETKHKKEAVVPHSRGRHSMRTMKRGDEQELEARKPKYCILMRQQGRQDR